MVFHSAEDIAVPDVDLLSWIFSGQEYDKDKDVYIDALIPNRRLSAREAESRVRKLITSFRQHGIKEGDSVIVQSFGDIMYPIVFLAIVGVGAKFVGCNPGSTAQELINLITLTSARYVLTVPSRLPTVLEAIDINAPSASISKSNVFILDTPHDQFNPQGFSTVTDLCSQSEEASELAGESGSPDAGPNSGNRTAALFSTSGTTGLPKVAAVSHRASIARCVASWDPKPKSYAVSKLICLPMFHGVAATASHIDPLRFGVQTYIQPRFEKHSFTMAIWEHKITETSMVPSIISMLLQQDETMSKEDLKKYLHSLRIVRCAGASLDTGLQQKFYELLHSEARIVNAWGLTEAGTVTSFFGSERDDTGSVGRLSPNFVARIIDGNGRDVVVDGIPGDILVRGPSLMTDYHKNEDACKEAFFDGWLRTGDIGYCKEGKWYIVGRSKDMMKVRSWQVAPAEIEACVMQHPLVLEVSVIGIKPLTIVGELPRAYVVLKYGSNVTSVMAEIHEMVGAVLAKYKALDGGITVVTSLPKTASGKVMKNVLRQKANEELLNGIR
ncbi:hypothetical protein BJ878DRAFT_108610 [Calycina marina]|uniref:Acetyl-CoA synthetase-like protein n=1 Tax=Calycina marina TaxID=1763456 RepID=A0A9P7Z1R5_9HELO|nr:hypothetical protein BJ878DRAFT_108610 [Calycina marina]